MPPTLHMSNWARYVFSITSRNIGDLVMSDRAGCSQCMCLPFCLWKRKSTMPNASWYICCSRRAWIVLNPASVCAAFIALQAHQGLHVGLYQRLRGCPSINLVKRTARPDSVARSPSWKPCLTPLYPKLLTCLVSSLWGPQKTSKTWIGVPFWEHDCEIDFNSLVNCWTSLWNL